MEARTSGQADLGSALDRIEAQVDAGSTDLRALGFWPLVARVKLDRALVVAHADQIGRIDTKAFRSGVRLRVPVWTGNTLLLLGIVVGALGVGAAFVWQDPMWKGLALIAAGVVWSVSVHSPTHWLVGTMVGIGWTDYFLGGAPPPRPGLKSDYATYLRADAGSRAWMHASGRDRDQGGAVRGAGVLAHVGRSVVGSSSLGGRRGSADRDGPDPQHQVRRLEEVRSREEDRPAMATALAGFRPPSSSLPPPPVPPPSSHEPQRPRGRVCAVDLVCVGDVMLDIRVTPTP